MVGWSFITADMRYIFNTLGLTDQTFELADGAGFERVTPYRIFGVSQDLLHVINEDYISFSEVNSDYMEEMAAKGKKAKTIEGTGGVIDAVDAMFTNFTEADPAHEALDTFGVRTVTSKIPPRKKPLGTVNLIIPEGLRDV